MSGADPMAELRLRFGERLAADADVLDRALTNGDWPEVERTVHGLAGAAGIFGLAGIGAQAAALDGVFAEGEWPAQDDVRTFVDALRTALAGYS